MKGRYAVVTEYFGKSNIVVNRLYSGGEIKEEKEIDLVSSKGLDEGIRKLMNEQTKMLSISKILERIIGIITI